MIYASIINKTRLSAAEKAERLYAVAVHASRLIDLYSINQNGVRVFVPAAIGELGTNWQALYAALQNYGLAEHQISGDAITVTTGGLSAGAASLKNYAVVSQGHISLGVDTDAHFDAPSRFVMVVYRLVEVLNFAGLTRVQALNKFESVCDAYDNLNDLALVDLSDLRVIQWNKSGVMLPVEVVDTRLGDAILHRDELPLTRGYVVTAADVTTEQAEFYNQALEVDGMEARPLIVTPVQVTERLVPADVRFMIYRQYAASNVVDVIPAIDAPTAEFFNTVMDAVNYANNIEPDSFAPDGTNTNMSQSWHTSAWNILPRRCTFVPQLASRGVDAGLSGGLTGYALVQPCIFRDYRTEPVFDEGMISEALIVRMWPSYSTPDLAAAKALFTEFTQYTGGEVSALVELPSLRVIRWRSGGVEGADLTTNEFLEASLFACSVDSPFTGFFVKELAITQENLDKYSSDSQNGFEAGAAWTVKTIAPSMVNDLTMHVSENRWWYESYVLDESRASVFVPSLEAVNADYFASEAAALAHAAAAGLIDGSRWEEVGLPVDQGFYYVARRTFTAVKRVVQS